MPKHSRKRQKLSNDEPDPLLDDAAKDDEERRLESFLFGTKYVPAETAEPPEDEDSDAEEGGAGGGGRHLQNLLDNDLFFVDDNVPVESGDEDEPLASVSGSGSDSHSESEDESPKNLLQNLKSKYRKASAWVDDSDPVSVSLSSKRLRKLQDTQNEEALAGREYESRLRRQFERINPEPQWAAKARKKSSKAVDGEEGEDVDINSLLASTSGIVSTKSGSSRSPVLAAGTIDISRLRDANQSAQNANCGDIKSLAFHPSERVPVLCVGSSDRRVRMYNIDGHTSPLLQTIHIPSLPLTSQSSVTFHPTGSHLLLTGSRPYYFVYDLQSGALTGSNQSKQGLWGTRFEDPSTTLSGPTSNRKRGRSRGTGTGVDESPSNGTGAAGMDITAFEPTTGSMLAVAGRGGYVHLVDWKSGAGQVLGSLKCSSGGGGVKGLWWTPPSATHTVSSPDFEAGSRSYLTVLTGDSEVYLWDVAERRCVRRWKDEGGFRGAGGVLAGSGKGSGWLAVGSNTGLVNVYGSDTFSSSTSSSTSSWSSHNPKPIKTIENLTTAISTLRFNHDAQVLAMASKEKKDGMRLIHLPTLTAFSNWPTSSTPLGHVTAVDFSARSEYLAIGNTRGRVLLYHLKDFGVH